VEVAHMGVDGNWQLVLNSPMGKQDVVLELKETGGQLTGVLVNKTNNLSTEILEGARDGDELRWKVKLPQGKMTLTFTTTVRDDSMSGKVKAGMFGSFTFTGQRAALPSDVAEDSR
jgi:hypothetical protein